MFLMFLSIGLLSPKQVKDMTAKFIFMSLTFCDMKRRNCQNRLRGESNQEGGVVEVK